MNRIQLQGKQGKIVATDGRQLLVHSGFRFPWSDNVLIPAMPAFGSRELESKDCVQIGRTDTHVSLKFGPWTLFLTTDAKARYPDVESVIPRSEGKDSKLRLSDGDADFMVRALPKLPGHADSLAPVTLDLGGEVVIRAKAEGTDLVSEVVLSHSHSTGSPVRAAVDRRYLIRLAQLGFRELIVADASRPLLCRDNHRLYLFMPLDGKAALQSSADPLRISSDSQWADSSPHSPEPQPRRRIPHLPSASSPLPHNGRGRENGATPSEEQLDPLAEAEALRDLLQNVIAGTGRLISALKQQRRQSRAVKAAMESIRRLNLDSVHGNG